MIVHEEKTTHDESVGDADLILRTRSGDTEAFGELWRRHYPSGLSVARSVTSSIDPDDLVQESYTRIYQAIVKGGGPNGSFRAYLFTSIRNTAAGWGRSRRETAIDELDTVADPETTDQAANEALDRSLTAQAFRSLPSRWQEVLWYTEIEQMKPQEVGPLPGMKAGAVSQLAFRAREGLREAWIQAHLRSAAEGSECQWTIEHLGAYSRGNLSTRDHKRLEVHLDECARCMIVAAEAKDVSTRLALVLLPLVLGVTGAAGYLATLQGGGAPIVALAGGASTIPGAVFGGDAGAAHAATGITAGGAGAGSGGSTGGAAGSSSGSASSGGAFTGIGALVGAGSAALVVAGVVAAAAIIPGLAGANPATSLPSAGDQDSSSIAADVGPDDTMSLDQPVAVEPPVVPPVAPAPPADEPAAPEQAAPDVAPPAVTAPPAPPVVPEQPVEPEKPVDPLDPVDPATPTTPPVWETATVEFFEDPSGVRIVYTVPVTGAPGATIEALLDGSTAGGGTTALDTAGLGSIVLTPTIPQYVLATFTTVTFRYVLASAPGPSADTTLYALEPRGGLGEQPPVDPTPVEDPAPEPAAAALSAEKLAPVDTAPVAATSPEASPAQAAPVEAAPAAPAAPAPVDAARVEAAPVEAAPTAETSAAAAPAAATTESPVTPAEDASTAE